jgi:hypothetical protein
MAHQEYLTLQDIQKLPIGDFLKQSPETEESTRSRDHYNCQNPGCMCDPINSIHIFEVNEDNLIMICDECYQSGYRFCLFTHDVLHIKDLEPVLNGMYAQPSYNQNQLNDLILNTVDDLYQYFKIVGIDNPYPQHTIVQLHEVD